jgi:mannose-6-phosphate isomerase-like protein (cupin superfamily)
MNTVRFTSNGHNHCALDLGPFDHLLDYSFPHPKLHKEIRGKQFVGELLKATGAEISFQLLPPNTEMPFLHAHKQHEEIYIFLRGEGQFQIDDCVFNVTEGSVIRIAPEGKRTYRNNSANPLIFMCIQCQAGTIDSFFVEDGFKAEGKIAWAR